MNISNDPDLWLQVVAEELKKLKYKENKKMLDLFKSPRFWGVVITSASVVLVDPSFPTTAWYISLAKFLGLVSAGTLGIRTVDRLGDKKVESAQITAGVPVVPNATGTSL